MGFPGGSEVKASACNVGDLGSIPGLGRSPGEGNGNPLQYSCLENPMDRGACWATVHRVAKSRTRLSDFTLPTRAKMSYLYFTGVLGIIFHHGTLFLTKAGWIGGQVDILNFFSVWYFMIPMCSWKCSISHVQY